MSTGRYNFRHKQPICISFTTVCEWHIVLSVSQYVPVLFECVRYSAFIQSTKDIQVHTGDKVCIANDYSFSSNLNYKLFSLRGLHLRPVTQFYINRGYLFNTFQEREFAQNLFWCSTIYDDFRSHSGCSAFSCWIIWLRPVPYWKHSWRRFVFFIITGTHSALFVLVSFTCMTSPGHMPIFVTIITFPVTLNRDFACYYGLVDSVRRLC